jgi:hypothetical protein
MEEGEPGGARRDGDQGLDNSNTNNTNNNNN